MLVSSPYSPTPTYRLTNRLRLVGRFKTLCKENLLDYRLNFSKSLKVLMKKLNISEDGTLLPEDNEVDQHDTCDAYSSDINEDMATGDEVEVTSSPAKNDDDNSEKDSQTFNFTAQSKKKTKKEHKESRKKKHELGKKKKKKKKKKGKV